MMTHVHAHHCSADHDKESRGLSPQIERFVAIFLLTFSESVVYIRVLGASLFAAQHGRSRFVSSCIVKKRQGYRRRGPKGFAA